MGFGITFKEISDTVDANRLAAEEAAAVKKINEQAHNQKLIDGYAHAFQTLILTMVQNGHIKEESFATNRRFVSQNIQLVFNKDFSAWLAKNGEAITSLLGDGDESWNRIGLSVVGEESLATKVSTVNQHTNMYSENQTEFGRLSKQPLRFGDTPPMTAKTFIVTIELISNKPVANVAELIADMEKEGVQ